MDAPASEPFGEPDWTGRYLNELATQRRLSPHTVAAYRRDLDELAALAGQPTGLP